MFVNAVSTNKVIYCLKNPFSKKKTGTGKVNI